MASRTTRAARLHGIRLTLFACLVSLVGAVPASAVEEVYVYHLLVRSRSDAEKALDEVINGGGGRKKFIDVARKFSMDHSSKGSGGDLGWNSRRKLVPEFADAAFSLEPGEVSEPVRTKFGWHVIYLKERRDLQAEAAAARKSDQVAKKTAEADPHAGHDHSGHDHADHDHADHAGHDHAEKKQPTVPTAIDPGSSASAATTTTPPSASSGAESATGAQATSEPETPAAVARPIKRSLPDRELHLALEVTRRSVTPTVPIDISLVLENRSNDAIKVFHPDLLPLGLRVRTDTTPAAPPSAFDSLEAPETFITDLDSRALAGGTFTLSDYFRDLPANCRLWVTWDIDEFTRNFERRFPGKAASVENFAAAVQNFPPNKPREFRKVIKGLPEHNSYVFTSKGEIPLSIFEPLSAQKRYFVRLDLSREDPIWFELFSSTQAQAAKHFARLVNEAFYDGLRIFDIQEGDYLQGGCPNNNGTGGPRRGAYLTNAANISHEKGILSLITRLRPGGQGREAGSVFFISRKDHKEFDDIHVPIGKLLIGEEVIEKIEGRNTRWANVDTISIVTEARAPARVLEAAGITTSVASADSSSSSTAKTSADTAAATGADPSASAAQAEATIVARPALPRARIDTNKGSLVVELYEDDARNTVANFISLVESDFYGLKGGAIKFFDEHPDYYIRTGSPDGSESGGPGYHVRSEVSSNTRRHEKGTLSMCLEINSSTGQPIPNTAGSQFFICLDDVPYWNGLYTPFGKVIEGLDVLAQLDKGDEIRSITILQKRQGLYSPTKISK